MDSNLTVMVYFHGGGLIVGGAEDQTPHGLMSEDIEKNEKKKWKMFIFKHTGVFT